MAANGTLGGEPAIFCQGRPMDASSAGWAHHGMKTISGLFYSYETCGYVNSFKTITNVVKKRKLRVMARPETPWVVEKDDTKQNKALQGTFRSLGSHIGPLVELWYDLLAVFPAGHIEVEYVPRNVSPTPQAKIQFPQSTTSANVWDMVRARTCARTHARVMCAPCVYVPDCDRKRVCLTRWLEVPGKFPSECNTLTSSPQFTWTTSTFMLWWKVTTTWLPGKSWHARSTLSKIHYGRCAYTQACMCMRACRHTNLPAPLRARMHACRRSAPAFFSVH